MVEKSLYPEPNWNRTVTHAVANYKKYEALKVTFRVSRFPATTLGERIRKRRLEMGLKQVELARLLGVNQGTIVNWEKDRNKPGSSQMETVVQGFLKGCTSRLKAELDSRKQEEKLGWGSAPDPTASGRCNRNRPAAFAPRSGRLNFPGIRRANYRKRPRSRGSIPGASKGRIQQPANQAKPRRSKLKRP